MKRPLFPKLRAELSIIYHADRGTISFEDPLGYVRPDLEFEHTFAALFEMFDGSHRIDQLLDRIDHPTDSNQALQHLSALVQMLDEELILDSPSFARARQFLERDCIEPVCAGKVYPDNPTELHAFIERILASSPARAYPQSAWAAFIPHIDYRVAAEHYAYPFNAIRESTFDVVVHIGTSHYGWQDRFLLTTKDFQTPLGRLRTDTELVEALRKEVGLPLVRNDIAYQHEHALELHHVFLQHLFPERKYTVLPVLVTSFHDLVLSQSHPRTDAKFAAFTAALRQVVEQSGRTPIVLVSGDLAHIGRRFGDQWDAAPMLDQLRGEDYQVLDAIARGKSDALFQTIAATSDCRRICGFPPAMTFLEAFRPGTGIALDYGQWNDLPTKSAVSFGSVAWYR
ncbi:MAG: MEMO1 family protein [Candidatus Kapaibacterium sp.]|nr:MAG: MEMO1 family protein [Candidatus Kapabacteria bacterium]